MRQNYTTNTVDFAAYAEQSRSLLENQRKHYEKERSFFDQERKLWNAERSMLKAQIADLELKLNKSTGALASGQGPCHDTKGSSGVLSTRASFTFGQSRGSDTAEPPDFKVWVKPDMGATLTRVFSNDSYSTKQSEGRLPSIAESPSSSQQKNVQILSPTKTNQSAQAVSIPIEKIDSSLDGINIKSTGLPSSIVKSIVEITPESPLRETDLEPTTKDDEGLHIDIEQVALSPYPENLIKDAGHTPIAKVESPESNTEGKTSHQSPPILDLQEPFSPGPTLRPPTERSNSYFPVSEEISNEAHEDKDIELKGPLTMEPEGQDSDFLSALDQKLEAEAHKAESSEHGQDDSKDTETVKPPETDEEGPKLRIKQSMNFGSAWGSTAIGKNV